MRFTVDRAPMVEAVTRVQGAAGGGKTVPILGMALLRAEQHRVTVRATDLTIQATASAAASVDGEGAVCVPVQQLHDLLRSLPEGGEIGFQTDASDPRVSVICGRSRFKLPTLPAADFPGWKDVAGVEASGAVRSELLARLIDKTLFAASTEDLRYYLQGVYLHVVEDGTTLRAVATDGMKLALADVECPADLAALPPVIIPTRLLSEMRRWLGTLQVEVQLSVTPSRVSLAMGDRALVGQTVDGNFPDYRRVIPRGEGRPARVDVGVLRSAIRRVMLAAEPAEKTKMRAVRGSFAPGRLGLLSRSPERGEAQEELEAVYDGPEIELACNGGQWLAIVERLSGETADLHVSAPLDPVLITDPSDPRVQFVMTTVRG